MKPNITVDRSELELGSILEFKTTDDENIQKGRIENIAHRGDDNHGELERVTLRTLRSRETKIINFRDEPTMDGTKLEHLVV